MCRHLLTAVTAAVEAAVHAVERNDQRAAQDVLAQKDDLHPMVEPALRARVGELTAEASASIDAFRLEMETLDKLERIHRWPNVSPQACCRGASRPRPEARRWRLADKLRAFADLGASALSFPDPHW